MMLAISYSTHTDPSLVDIDGMCAIHWAIHRHETGTLKVLGTTFMLFRQY